jgi:hypothetical protein
MLKNSGALTILQALGDNPVTEQGFQVARGVTERVQEGLNTIGRAEARWLAAHGMDASKGLLLNKIDPNRRAFASDAMRVLYMKMTGRDRDQIVKYVKDGKVVGDNVAAWTTPEKLDELVQQYGLGELVGESQKFLDMRKQQLFGREGVQGFKPDPDKIIKMWRGLSNKAVWGKEATDGGVLLRQVLGDDLAELSTKMSENEFRELVETTFTSSLNQNYLPRNMYTTVNPAGPMGRKDRSQAQALRAATTSIARMRGDALHADEDLEAIARLVGGENEALTQARAQAKGIVRDAMEEDRAVRFLAMNPVESVRKYNNDSALSWSWFIQPPDARTKEAWTKWVAAGGGKPYHKTLDDKFGDGLASYEDLANMDAVAPSRQPAGGLSLADLTGAAWATTKTPYDRRAIANLVVPTISGRHGVDHLFTAGLVEMGKRGVRSFLNTDVGKQLGREGGLTARFAQELERFADEGADSIDQARNALRSSASFLYGTHLSGNVPSAILNATQPFHMAATWIGLGNTAKGYGKAVDEWMSYANERVSKHGIGPIAEDVRRSMMKKHFKHFDLIEASAPVLEQLDAEAFAADRQPKGLWSNFMHYGMSLFRNAEVMNRLATGHAVEAAYKSTNRIAKGATFERDVQRMVMETQFAQHPLNTPIAFMTADQELSPFGRVLANPLARQFLSFPLRTFTSLVHTAPRIAGREGGFGGVANDFMRSMAASAVMVVGARSLFGADIERAGFLSGATDILPGFSGGRFDARESPIPIPPVLDIPVGIVRGILGDDTALLGRSISRLIPGGVAVSRALGVIPQTPLEWIGVQQTHVDWTMRGPDGKVPVFDDSGNVLATHDPSELILRAVGADLGKFRSEGQLTNHLVKNRQEILQYRKAFLDAKTGGNGYKAEAIAKEYEKRFKIPLTVTQDQTRRYLKNREMPRPQRVFQTLPNEAKPIYADMLAQQMAVQQRVGGGQPVLNVPSDQGDTGRAYSPFGGFGR